MLPFRLPVLALLATVAVVLGAAVPAQAASRSRIGVQVLSITGATAQQDLVQDLRRASKLHIRTVRVEVRWDALEPDRKGTLDGETLDAVDRFFREAGRRGIRVMMTVDGTPCWASAAPDELRGDCSGDRDKATHYPPADPQDFVPVATFLAQRYQRQLVGFEVWNEPDQRNELYWAGPDKVKRYVALTKAVYGPLKEAAPNVPVLAGAFVGSDGRWLKALYDAGFKGSYDQLSVHFYDLTLAAIRNIRRIQRQYGDRTPLFLGETGWSSCYPKQSRQDGHLCASRGGQGRFTTDLIRSLRRASYVKGAIFYTMQDSRAYDFGMFTQDNRMKAAGWAMRRELRRKKNRSPRSMRVRIYRRGNTLRMSGSAPAGEVYEITVRQRGFLRFRAYTRLTRSGRLSYKFPSALGTRGLTITIRAPFLKRRVVRRV